MRSTAWKDHERRVAKKAGTHRTPLSGSNSRHNTKSDSLSNEFYIESKWSGSPRSSFFIFANILYNSDKRVKEANNKKFRAIRVTHRGESLIAFRSPWDGLEYLDVDLDNNKFLRRMAVWNFFFDDVVRKAAEEKHIPLLAIHNKNRNGDVYVCYNKDISRVKEIFNA